MKLIDAINNIKDCKIKPLQFFDAIYDEKNNQLELILLTEYDTKSYNINEIEDTVKSYLNNKVNVIVKIKKNLITNEFVEVKLREYILNAPVYKLAFDSENIQVLTKNNEFEITLFVDELQFDDNIKLQFENNFKNMFEQYNFNAVFIYKNKVSNNFNIIDQRRDEIEEENTSITSYVKYQNAKLFLGRKIDAGSAVFPNGVKAGDKDIFVCGEISNINEYEKRKTTENDKEKKYYKFDITENEVSLNCVCFSKDGQGLFELEQNEQVMVFGNIDEFNGNISLRVTSMFLCSYEKPEKIVKKASKYYKVVKPEPYINFEQASFLDIKEQSKSNYLLNNEFVVFDLETTGLDYKTCKIIEIGAVKIKNGEIVEQFSTFVNPEKHIDDEASKKNNIFDDMVKDAPIIDKVIPDFYKFCENCILVAHNIEFDLPFLNYYAKQVGYNFNNEKEDTMILGRKYLAWLKHFRLIDLCEELGVSLIGAHRAVNDTVATAKVFIKLIEKYDKR